MQEVREPSCESTGRSLRAGWSGLAFWVIGTAGLILFALGVLAPEYVQRLEMRRQLAVEEAKTQQVRQAMEDMAGVHDALANDPKALARQIRRDLGYRRSGEQPLPFEPQALAPALEDPTPAGQYETRLDRLCRLFGSAFLSRASLACGLMLMAVSLICFHIPTQTKPAAGRQLSA